MADMKDKTIGGFRVLQEIQAGSGSQGTVYKAVCVDPKDGLVPAETVVALKVMAVQDEGQEQWKKLAKRTAELARLDSPNVVKYYGCFSETGLFNDIHVVVQEFLHGETLKDRLSRFSFGLDVDEALRIADAALAGLEYTSSRGIIHRDIKPGNIFLCSDGSVKLIDFEIARQSGGTTTASTGNIRGSFDYMAPDFTDAVFHGDVRSDVFSMGVVLHEMLAGKTPYQRLEGSDKQANFAFLSRWAHTLSDGRSPIRVSSRINRLLAHADEVISRAVAPQRENRYPDFSAFREGLRTIHFRNLRNGRNNYQMLQFVGKGGFGEVFKARIKETGRYVAVKHLLKAEYAKRFEREAKIMKKLHDPCFVQFVDFFTIDAAGSRESFLVMAFLDGMPGNSLRNAIKEAGGNRLPEADVFRAFERYAKGLQAMHAEGIFHRDIKPSNLYFPAGRPQAAAIMDLGIARDVNGTATHGQVPGTLDYMPPEVVLTESRGDGGMDIYALGLCFYEALTGKTAFPRLPTGTAAYAAFFERAKSKRKPQFDAPEVVRDKELLALLTDMTNPEHSRRIHDAGKLASRIRNLREKRFPDTFSNNDDDPPEPETSPETILFDAPTDGTIDMPSGTEKFEALERERKKLAQARRKRLAKTVFAVFIALLMAGAGVYFVRKRAASYLPFLREEVIPPTPPVEEEVAVTIEDFGKDVTLTLNGKKLSSGEIALKPGEYVFQYSKQDCVPQEKKLTVLPGAPAKVPAPGKWEETQESIRRREQKGEELRRKKEAEELRRKKEAEEQRRKKEAEELRRKEEEELRRKEEEEELRRKEEEEELRRKQEEEEAGLKAAREKIVSECKALMENEPVEKRQANLSKALEKLKNVIDTDKILSEDEAKEIKSEIEEIEKRQRWVVGRIGNACRGVAIDVGGKVVEAGQTETLVFENGLPEDWSCKVAGYEPKALSRDFDGKTISIGEGDLVEAEVQVALPKIGAGITCFFNEKEVSGPLSLKPGAYSCIYRRTGYEEQAVRFEVPFGKSCELPMPGEWKALPVEVSVPEFPPDVVCLVDGTKVGSSLRLPPGEHVCEFRRADCVTQRKRFAVVAATPMSLPRADAWEPTEGLKSLDSAEEYAQRKDWSAAERALENADVKSDENKARKTRLAELVRKQAMLGHKVEQAVEYYDNEYYGDAVKYYYEACELGYLMSDEDKQRAAHAYNAKHKELRELIDWTKREIKRGRSVDRSVADLEKEDKSLLDRYNAIKRQR